MDRLSPEARKVIDKKVAEKVIKGYLAIKKLKEEKNYGDEYIRMMYKVFPTKYESLYNALNPELREECEAEIRESIKNGDLDLDKHLVELYKESKLTNNGREH